MHLVPIPVTPEHLRQTEPIWFPFLQNISAADNVPLDNLVNQVRTGQTQVILVWDGKRAVSLYGVRILRHGTELLADAVWASGKKKVLYDSYPELERYLKENGCAAIRSTTRAGWWPSFKKQGYKMIYITVEKKLCA